MTAIGRMSVSALAGSSNISDRRLIEQAIENHIQLIQQADSLLTYDNIPTPHRTGEDGITRACRKPAEYLAKALEQKGLISSKQWTEEEDGTSSYARLFPAFPNPGKNITDQVVNTKIDINTNYNYDEDKSIVIVTYTFEAPEASIGIEKRFLELSPNFQSECTPYEATSA